MKNTFELKVELPLAYHALFALACVPEGKTVNELLVEILTGDKRIKKLKKRFDDLPPEPENFGLVPHPNSPLRKLMRSRNEMYSDDNCICEGQKINPECARHGDNK